MTVTARMNFVIGCKRVQSGDQEVKSGEESMGGVEVWFKDIGGTKGKKGDRGGTMGGPKGILIQIE